MQKAYTRQLKQFGQNVKRLRQAKNISQYDLADMCEVDRRTVQRIEAGTYRNRLDTVFTLCAALGASLSELFVDIKVPELQYFTLGKTPKAKTKKKKK